MKRSILTTVFLAGVALPVAAIAQAQTAGPVPAPDPGSTNVDDIVVTAQKREERLQDVPIAITALGAEALQARGIDNIVDMETAALPGLRISRQAGGGALAIAIRGVSTSNQTEVTRESGTALYIDGVYIPRSQGLSGELIEPERIEVVRGPQGTLFGRNAEGGAVSITSAKPTGEFGGTITARAGDYGQTLGAVRVNLPEFANLSLRIDALQSEVGGYVKNREQLPGQTLSEHRDFGEQDNWGARAQLLWRPHADFSALYSFDRSELSYTPEYNYRVGTPLGARQVDPSRVDQSWMPIWLKGWDALSTGHGLTLTWDVNADIQLKSITSRRFVREEGGTNLANASNFLPVSPTRSVSGFYPYGLITSESQSQEFQLIGALPRVEYLIGTFYFHEEARDRRQTFATIIYDGAAPPVSVNPFPLGGATQASIESTAYAVFAQATYTPDLLNDALKITVGGRYTQDRKSAAREIRGGVVFDPPLRPADQTESRFDPAVTIAYQPSDNLNIYARYASAFRSGGISIASPTFAPFGAEENKQVELGLKSGLFDRLLTFNLAGWHSWVRDRQTSVIPDPAAPSVTDTVNSPGTSRLYGFEMEASATPVSGLRLSGSLNYQDGELQPYPCGNCTARYFSNFPEWVASAAIDYRFPVGDVTDLSLHLDYNYTSEYHKAPTYGPGLALDLPSQDKLLNGRVALEDLPVGPFLGRLAVQVLNITDSRTIATDTPLNWEIRQLPRRFTVDFTVAF